jgi:hypothetical protein
MHRIFSEEIQKHKYFGLRALLHRKYKGLNDELSNNQLLAARHGSCPWIRGDRPS